MSPQMVAASSLNLSASGCSRTRPNNYDICIGRCQPRPNTCNSSRRPHPSNCFKSYYYSKLQADVGHVPIYGSGLVPTSVPLVVLGLVPTTMTFVSAGVGHVPTPVTAVAGHVLATVSNATIIQTSSEPLNTATMIQANTVANIYKDLETDYSDLYSHINIEKAMTEKNSYDISSTVYSLQFIVHVPQIQGV